MQRHMEALREIERRLDALGGEEEMQRHLGALRDIDRRLDAWGPWYKSAKQQEEEERKAKEKVDAQKHRNELWQRQADVMAWARGRGCDCEIIEGVVGCIVKTRTGDEVRVQGDDESGGWMRVSILKKGGLRTTGDKGCVSSLAALEEFLIRNKFTF
jgi:hypothetical protein